MSGSISNIFRWLFFLLDSVVYWFIDQMYSLFLMLTEASVFSQEQIENFASRIYVLISIIMLFRLGFSFVNYIVNPESFTDKQKGGGALIKSVVIAVVLLVTVPTIFQEANYLQQVVFKSNVIERVLLGDSSIKDGSANNSRLLSTYSFLSFFRPNSRVSGCSSFEGVQISSECINSLNQMADDNSNPGNLYAKALKELNISYVLNSNVINTTGTFVTAGAENFYQTDTTYLFNYHFLISTVFGGVVAYILLGFCIDLAIRTVKLGFLQLIAPVPIILSISPGTKNNTLSNWGKECLSTWVSLFIRVLVIIFAINAILLINSGGGIFSFVTGGGNNSFMVTVFVMLGLLLFAKEFPKLLEDLLGIKGAGNMTFNAWKKLGSTPLVGGALTAGATMAGGAALLAGRALTGGARALASGIGGRRKIFDENGNEVGRTTFGERFKENWSRNTSDRVSARWSAMKSSAGEKLSSAGLTGTDKLGGSMSKSYAERYKKNDRAEIEKGRKLGDNLLDDVNESAAKAGNAARAQYMRDNGITDENELNNDAHRDRVKAAVETAQKTAKSEAKYSMFSSRSFSEGVKKLDEAKVVRDSTNETLRIAQMQFESSQAGGGEATITVQTGPNPGDTVTYTGQDAIQYVTNLEIHAKKAESAYNNAKKDVDELGKLYSGDAKKYAAFSAAEDRRKKVGNYVPGQYSTPPTGGPVGPTPPSTGGGPGGPTPPSTGGGPGGPTPPPTGGGPGGSGTWNSGL